MASIPNSGFGATFYMSSSTGVIEPAFNSSESNVLHSERVESLADELDNLCGPPFICNWESTTAEAVVVYNNFEHNERGDNEGQTRRGTGATPHMFRSLTLLGSEPTSDGLGVKLRFELSSDTAGIPASYPVENFTLGSPVVAATRTRRSRLGRRRKQLLEKITDSELLAKRVRYHQARFYNLCDQTGENPFIRCVHWYHDGRTFAFASIFVRIRNSRKAIVAVLWHTKTRPHRAVCISLSLERTRVADSTESETTPPGDDQLVAHCSCSPLLSQIHGTNSSCYHAQVCLADEDFHRMVYTEIRRREHIQDLEDRGDTIFGQCIPLSDESLSPTNFSVLLDRNASKNSTLATPWLFFMTFDTESLLFVPVSKLKGKPFRCFLCRIPLSRRGVCGHEETSKQVSKLLRRRRGGRAGVLLDLALPINRGGNPPAETDTGLLVADDDADDEDSDEDNVTKNRSVSVPETYTPIDMRRPVLPCRGEWEDMISIAKALNAVQDGEIIILDDRVEGKCHKCGQSNDGENCNGYSRNV